MNDDFKLFFDQFQKYIDEKFKDLKHDIKQNTDETKKIGEIVIINRKRITDNEKFTENIQRKVGKLEAQATFGKGALYVLLFFLSGISALILYSSKAYVSSVVDEHVKEIQTDYIQSIK